MTKRLKPLRPTLREKKRYIVFEIISEKTFTFQEVKNAMLNACIRCIGEFGCAKANLYIIENMYISDKNRGIVRVSNKSVDDVKASLLTISKIHDTDVAFRTMGISGILKKAKNKFLLKDPN